MRPKGSSLSGDLQAADGAVLGGFLRASMVVLILVNLANLFNYLFLLMAGRVMTAADFGMFNSLNSLAQIWVTPTVVLPMLAARFAVRLSAQDMGAVKTFFIRSQQGLLIFGALSVIVAWLFMTEIKGYLHIETTSLIYLTISYVIIAVLYPMMAGILQGLHRYVIYALGTCGIMFFRLLAGVVLLVLMQGGVAEALVASIIGVVVALVMGLWSLRDLIALPMSKLPPGLVKDMGRYTVPVLLTTVLVILLSNLDIVLVRHYLPADEAGNYSVAAILGRIAFFLPGALIGVLFPSVARSQEEGKSGLGFLWVSMGVTVLIGFGVTAIFTLWPETVISIMFADKYLDAAPMLPVISAAMALLGAANILYTYYLARSETRFIWFLFFGFVAFVIGVKFRHDSAVEIAQILLICIAGSFGLSLLTVLRRSYALRKVKSERV